MLRFQAVILSHLEVTNKRIVMQGLVIYREPTLIGLVKTIEVACDRKIIFLFGGICSSVPFMNLATSIFSTSMIF